MGRGFPRTPLRQILDKRLHRGRASPVGYHDCVLLDDDDEILRAHERGENALGANEAIAAGERLDVAVDDVAVRIALPDGPDGVPGADIRPVPIGR